MTNAPQRPIMRYHGGKWRLAPWLISMFPPHRIYVEPFGGAGSVLLQKPRSEAEIYNDLDDDIVNVMRVLRDSSLREQLEEALILTPYSRVEFENAFLTATDPVERARRTLIRAEMGFGSAGATQGATGFRHDSKRNYGTAMSIWARMPEGLAAFTSRLHGVLIENREAVRVLVDHDSPETLHYVDPPYLHDTRKMGNVVYRHEMSDADHFQLLETVCALEGMVFLSGYPSQKYDQQLKGWMCVETKARIAAARGTALRTEAVWINPAAQARMESDLFSGGAI